jgi:hypothetical protein
LGKGFLLMRLTEQNHNRLRRLIAEAIHSANAEIAQNLQRDLERLISLDPVLDFGSHKDTDRLDGWLAAIKGGKGGLSKSKPGQFSSDVAAADILTQMLSKDSFARALEKIEGAIGPELFGGDTKGERIADLANWNSLSEAYGSSLTGGGSSTPSSRILRGREKRGAMKGSAPRGSVPQGKASRLSAKDLESELARIFSPPDSSLGGLFGVGMSNQSFLKGLSKSIAQKIMGFTPIELKSYFTKYAPELAGRFAKSADKSGFGTFGPSGDYDDEMFDTTPKEKPSHFVPKPAAHPKGKGLSGNRPLFAVEREMRAKGMSVRPDIIDYLINKGIIDPTKLEEALRRGRTKVIVNEGMTRAKIINY